MTRFSQRSAPAVRDAVLKVIKYAPARARTLGSGEKPRRSCLVAENMKDENATTWHVTVPHGHHHHGCNAPEMKFLYNKIHKLPSWRSSECTSTPQRIGEYKKQHNTKHLCESASQTVSRCRRHHHGCDEAAKRLRMASQSGSSGSPTKDS